MKKIVAFFCILTAMTMLLGCGAGSSKEVEGSLTDLMDTIYKEAAPDIPETMTMPLENDTLPYYLGVTSLDFEEGLICEPMMGSYAHSVVLVRMKDGADIEAAKKEIRETVNPRKWICVEVEEKNVIVDNIGNLIILIMSNDSPEELHQAFLNLAK